MRNKHMYECHKHKYLVHMNSQCAMAWGWGGYSCQYGGKDRFNEVILGLWKITITESERKTVPDNICSVCMKTFREGKLVRTAAKIQTMKRWTFSKMGGQTQSPNYLSDLMIYRPPIFLEMWKFSMVGKPGCQCFPWFADFNSYTHGNCVYRRVYTKHFLFLSVFGAI